MKRLLWIVGLPIFLAACGAPGGLYGTAPAPSSKAAPAASAVASTPTPVATPAATPPPAPATSASVLATPNALGTILTNAQGGTLYYFLPERGGKIVCSSSACTTYWPPSLTAGGNPTGGAGVTGQLRVVMRAAGDQITYNTWPLYTFAGDKAPGQTTGQGVVGFGGKWLVATPGLQP
jgi:predicted lipoprotein with Yx(FWY)xxD motif